jgi:hypothetical protein
VVTWLETQNDSDYSLIRDALEALLIAGPSLGRPFVDRLKGTKFHNLKELRPLGSQIRLLFAFDPKRKAIVLVAGDKTNSWTSWYEQNIPIAEKRYADHLRLMKGN